MKIIAPHVNQTGEVRLLSKLLNQKVRYSVLYMLEGEDTDSSRPLSLQESRELGRNASASTGIINI